MRKLAHSLPILLFAVALASAPAAAAPSDPWAALARARTAMQQAGPQLWRFDQTYLPNGFVRGEEEGGRVALDLPRCVRWDYDEPYPKSFLLCSETLWTWNPGEPAGHVYALDQAQPGLDLLLLAVDDLAQRYDASAQAVGGGQRVKLVPKRATAGDSQVLKDAAILLDREGRLRELTYRDAEGNRTTFRFRDRRPANDSGKLFEPPGNVKWERESGRQPG